jgi:hypothetical protein
MIVGSNVDGDTTLLSMAETAAIDNGVMPDGWLPLLG